MSDIDAYKDNKYLDDDRYLMKRDNFLNHHTSGAARKATKLGYNKMMQNTDDYYFSEAMEMLDKFKPTKYEDDSGNNEYDLTELRMYEKSRKEMLNHFKAKKMYDRDKRRQKQQDKITSLEEAMAALEAAQNAGGNEKQEVKFSSKVQDAQSGVEEFENALGGDFMNSKKAEVKDALAQTGTATRGPESIIGDNTDVGGGAIYTDAKPSAGPTNITDKYGANAYLKDYKLDLAEGLTPNNRASAVQNDKDARRVHQIVQKPNSPTPSDFVFQPGKGQMYFS